MASTARPFDSDPLQAISAAAGAVAARVASSQSADQIDAAVLRAIDALLAMSSATPYWVLPSEVERSSSAHPLFATALVSALLQRLPDVLQRRALPDGAHSDSSAQAFRIASRLSDPSARPYSFDEDDDVKDLALCRLALIACGAQVVDVRSGLPWRLLLRQTTPVAISHATRIIAARAFVPYWELHTHTPMTEHFTPAGWTDTFLKLAQMMRETPSCHGIFSMSWYFDPAVARISPRLAYLTELPLAHGAFLLYGGATRIDALLATQKSPTRRRLYAASRYSPAHYALIWPRHSLLAWADRQSATTFPAARGSADVASAARTTAVGELGLGGAA